MKNKIITIGSLTFDLFVQPLRHEIVRRFSKEKVKQFLQFPFGEKIRTKNVHECFGGGAANCAIGLKRLGLEAMPFGAVGNDSWAEGIFKNFAKENISSEYLQKVDEKTGFSVILNSFEGERTVLAYAGANHAIEKIDTKILYSAEGIHLCHLSGKSKKIFSNIEKFFQKNPKKFLSFNPGKEQIEQGLKKFSKFLSVVDVLFLNLEEAEEFSGLIAKTLKGQMDLSPIFHQFFKHNFSGIINITNGRGGAYCCDGKDIYYCSANNNLPRVDTLGAGDAFASAFSASIFKKKSLQKALEHATLNAGNVVANFGAQKGLLTEKEINSIIRGIKISKKKLK